MAGVQKRREGDLGARPRVRDKEGEESVPLPPFSHTLVLLAHLKHPFPSLPFRMPPTAEKEEYVFTRNIEILVNKPSLSLNSIFVIFLASQCSLLLFVIKAFNKRQ